MVAGLKEFDVTQITLLIPASDVPVRKLFQQIFPCWNFRAVCQANEQKALLCVLFCFVGR